MEVSKKPQWTKAEIVEFDRLIDESESPNQVARIRGRLDLSAFVKLHGKDKCDAMWAHLEAGGKKENGPLVEVQS